MVRKTSPILSLIMVAMLAFAAAAKANSLPTFKMTIKPVSMEKTDFDIAGDVETSDSSLSFVLMPWHAYKFARDGKTIEVTNNTEIHFADNRAAKRVHFNGTTQLRGQKCAAADGEIYCLNNSIPNPEVKSSGSYYDVHFVLPHGYSALAADREAIQLNGLEFQIAHFAKPIVERVGKTKLVFAFPEGFLAKREYLDYVKDQLAIDLKQFGELPFTTLKIGVLRRGGGSEINGNPSGNLILYSRTALGDPVSLSSPGKLGIDGDLTDGL
jgi:hypothetical protein